MINVIITIALEKLIKPYINMDICQLTCIGVWDHALNYGQSSFVERAHMALRNQNVSYCPTYI